MNKRQRRIQKIFLFLLLAAVSAPFSGYRAADKNLINVALDNEFIQTYKSRLGRWILWERNSLETIGRQFDTTAQEILAINDGHASPNSYIFIPMGQKYYNELLEQGRGRRIMELDQRKLLWPVENPNYTSRFGNRWGEMHSGLDMACARNTVVVAANDGEVIAAGWFGALGQALGIRHADGVETWYGHNTTLLAKIGDRVTHGQIVALSGSTGRSTGPHVHFEVRFMEVFMNPEDFLEYGFVAPDVVMREVPPMEGQHHNEESALYANTPPANN